jgi:5-methylcytosine-specific restriction endonuclease McrA
MMQLSKKLRKAFVRTLIDMQPMGKPFSRMDAVAFSWLTGLDATHFVREQNPEFPDDKRHIKVNGCARSWNRSIDGYDETQAIKRAMRSAISSDLRDFLSAIEPAECTHCGSTEQLTVDHVAPPFNIIASEFVSEYGDKITLAHNENGVGNRFADADLEAAWIAFHASRAVYQVLCRSCNARKGARMEDAA